MLHYYYFLALSVWVSCSYVGQLGDLYHVCAQGPFQQLHFIIFFFVNIGAIMIIHILMNHMS